MWWWNMIRPPVGHSERRSLYGETDADVAEKAWNLSEKHGLVQKITP